NGWTTDIVIGRATKEIAAQADFIPSTSTLDHWIDRSNMKTKTTAVLQKVARTPRKDSPKHRENRRVLGPSTEERPDKVDTREHFGHWEIDTLIGSKTKEDPVLLTLVERKTRFEIMFKIKQKSTDFVNQAVKQLYDRIGNQ